MTSTSRPPQPAQTLRTLDDATAFLYRELGTFAGRFDGGLTRARALVRALGDPQDRYRSVHVAGTAGKGSVVSFVAGLLHAHGFTVGAHLSPHAHSILERFQLDGCPIGDADFVRALADAMPAIRRIAGAGLGQPTFFEVTAALAWQLFADRAVDYAVVETGLGGRLDATNTITRADKLALLTVIGRDHTEILGDSLPEIAREKAGILPRNGHAIAVAPSSAAVASVLTGEAARRHCRLDMVDTRPGPGPEPVLGLPGRHQVANASLALRAVAELAARDGWTLDPGAVRRALRDVRMPGRFERRSWCGHPIVLDGAHNALKLASVVSVLHDEHPGQRFAWVLAVKPDKDLRDVVAAVAPAASAIVATEFADHTARISVPAEVVAAAARRAGVPSVAAITCPKAALRRAVELSAPNRPVVVAGSFHVVAAVGAAIAPSTERISNP
ncbi:MAG: hypothetical protein L0H64_10650 [Pseudonocardia sp.]|nr:hypothetical protein [Pseudonocardia sp.]